MLESLSFEIIILIFPTSAALLGKVMLASEKLGVPLLHLQVTIPKNVLYKCLLREQRTACTLEAGTDRRQPAISALDIIRVPPSRDLKLKCYNHF